MEDVTMTPAIDEAWDEMPWGLRLSRMVGVGASRRIGTF